VAIHFYCAIRTQVDCELCWKTGFLSLKVNVPAASRRVRLLDAQNIMVRYHERRACGRNGASPSLVLRGSARLIAALASRTCEVSAADLAAADPDKWKRLRAELEERRQRRVDRRRFRRDLDSYLKGLGNKLIQSRCRPSFFAVPKDRKGIAGVAVLWQIF
jgi:hypothetical protein